MQDDWRIGSDLTLNYGLRYEFARSPVERDDKSLVFAPDVGQILLAGEGVRRDIVDPDWNNFAPRLGFTWRPPVLADFVVRGGAGIYYATDNFNEEQFKGTGPPFFQAQTIEGNPQVPNLFMRDMMPSFTNSPNVNPFTFDRGNRTPYLTQWSLGAQKSLWKDYLLEVEYTGSTGRKLPQRRNLNIGRIDPTGTIPLVQRVPYRSNGFILMTYNGGWSSYNALTTKLEKRFAKGLYFLGCTPGSKASILVRPTSSPRCRPSSRRTTRATARSNVPHRFVGTWVYELPFGRGRALLADLPTALDAVLGGWQVSGIVTVSQGQFRRRRSARTGCCSVRSRRRARTSLAIRPPAASSRCLPEPGRLQLPARRAG